jgi:hypothetical protein
MDRGMLDLVVDRRDLKATLARALRFMGAAPAPEPVPLEAVIAPDAVNAEPQR